MDGPFEVRTLVDDYTAEAGLGGYTLVMSYDPSVLRALSVVDSGYTASTGNPVICPSSGVDNAEGTLAILCFTIPIFLQPGPTTTQAETLARITFEPIAVGSSLLDISGSSLSDTRGGSTVPAIENGSVTVTRGTPVSSGVEPTTSANDPASAGTPQSGASENAASAFPSAGGGPETTASTVWVQAVILLFLLGAILTAGGALAARRRGGTPRVRAR